jgi:hypothetical protein
MNRNMLDELINTIKNIFTPRDKKLVPVKVPVSNPRRFK